MKDATRYNLPENEAAAPPVQQVGFKDYKDLVAGDRLFWAGQIVEVTQPMAGNGTRQGNIVRFRTEFVSGPLKGLPCYISGLAYGSVQIQSCRETVTSR
jgi:hypothetical protein